MYNPRAVLKQWGKCDEPRRQALKTDFLDHQDDPLIRNDFLSFLARQFGLYEGSPPSMKSSKDK
jgi:hypothetical protein